MVSFHVPTAVVSAIATGAVSGLTYYATNSNGTDAVAAGAIAAAISAGLMAGQASSSATPPTPATTKA
jgi:hypothetical protein